MKRGLLKSCPGSGCPHPASFWWALPVFMPFNLSEAARARLLRADTFRRLGPVRRQRHSGGSMGLPQASSELHVIEFRELRRNVTR